MDESKAIAAGEKAGAKFSFVEFARETRREIAKVTWPTRKATLMTTAMIVAFALAFGVFFLAVDSVLGYAIGRILGMKG